MAGLALMSAPAQAAPARYNLTRTTLPNGETRVVRWNPCQRVITYRVNVAGVRGRAARARAVHEVRVSARRLARVSGLPLRFTGRTGAVPTSSNVSRLEPEIVVAFVRPRRTDFALRGSTAGRGGTTWRWESRGGHYTMQVVKGFVVIDHPQTRRWSKSLARRGVTRPALIRHELGHAVGLGHVSDRAQAMYPMLGSFSPRGFAPGDRAGLRRIGRPAGCIR